MKKPTSFASIGELCIDIYPQEKKLSLGGTAFNTAIHAKKAGAQVSIFSAIGTDDYGQMFTKSLQSYAIDSSQIISFEGKTSSLTVTIAKNGQRSFSEWRLGILKKYGLGPSAQRSLAEYSVARMTLFKPLQKLFDAFAEMQLPNTVKVADFAGSSQYSEGFGLLENYSEYFDILIKSVDNKTDLSFFRQLSFSHTKKLFLILRGEKGSVIFSNGIAHEQSAIKTTVIDTNGAGDSYIAHFLISYLEDKDIAQAMLHGSKAAARTISQFGAAV